MPHPPAPPRRVAPSGRVAPWLAVLLLLAGAALAAAWWWRAGPELPGGLALNRLAFEATYAERGLPAPAEPRDGFWNARIEPRVPDPVTNWREREQSHPGLVEIEAGGLQRAGRGGRRVLVLGGSVAFGSYASSVEDTWFQRLHATLERRLGPLELVVAAAGAWKSVQEVAWLQAHGPDLRPELVVFLDGLNDLTAGARSDTLYSQPVPTRDGRPFDPLYHEHDYERRVADYLELLRRGQALARGWGARTLFVLQPSLAEKRPLSRIEERLLAASLAPHASLEALRSSYAAQRAGLAALGAAPDAAFADLSRAFDGDPRTTFTDLWHFSDPGHARVAELLAPMVEEVLWR